MKRHWAAFIMGIGLMAASALAAAQGRPMGPPGGSPGGPPGMSGMPMGPPGADPSTGRPVGWQTRNEPDRDEAIRLSPEERRQLRRDINEHGREIYRDRERDRRGPPR